MSSIQTAEVPGPPRVLLVEDDPVNRRILSSTLTEAGYVVDAAAGVLAAMQFAVASPPSYAVVDLRLPDGSGVELARALHRLDGCEELPIVAMSGIEATLLGIEQVAELFVARLLKPVIPGRLVEILHGHQGPMPGEDAPPAGPTILVVDDEPLMRRLLAAYLGREGYTLRTADDGQTALAELRKDPPDLVVADLAMPGIGGAELAQRMRSDRKLCDIPIVLVTAGIESDASKEVARSAGVEAIVAKTSDLRGLLVAVSDALEHRETSERTDPGGDTLGRIAEHAQTVNELRAQLTAREAELSVLAGIADALRRARSVDEVLDTTLERICDLTTVDFAASWVPNPRGELVLSGTAAVPDAQRALFERLPARHALLRSCLRLGELAVLPSDDLPPEEVRAVLTGLSIETAIIIPLVSDDRPLGMMLLGALTSENRSNSWALGHTLQSQLVQTLSLIYSLKAVEATAAAFSAIAESISDAVVTVADNQKIIYTNGVARMLLGPGKPPEGELLRDWLHPDDEADPGKGRWTGQLKTHNGRTREVAVRASRLPPGSPLGTVAFTLQDMTARRQHEEWLRRLANEDPLTGLPNRRAFEAQLSALNLRKGRRQREQQIGIAYFDLDGFKPVNDVHGHETGDVLLRGIATRVRARLRTEEFIARVGGDEFAVLLRDTDMVEIRAVGEIVRELVAKEAAKHPGSVTASVGVALGLPGQAAATVVEAADRAMYAAKRAGGNAVWVAPDPGSVSSPPSLPRASG